MQSNPLRCGWEGFCYGGGPFFQGCGGCFHWTQGVLFHWQIWLIRKRKQHPAVDMSVGESKVWYYKEQYCIATWSVRYINQGKLEVIKQEMARVNIDILGISKLNWVGLGEFNSDDHYTHYCGQESHRINGVAIIVNKRVQNAVLGCNLKNDRRISVHFLSKPFNITVIQVSDPKRNAEEAEVEWFYEGL